MRQRLVIGIIGVCLAAMACGGTPSATTPPIIVFPTFTPQSVDPTATVVATPMGVLAVGTQVTVPTAAATQAAVPTAQVVASHESGGTYAVALLTAVRLTPGHSYQLVVSSPAGTVAFHGEWSTSAVGADGMPGVKAGLLEGTTPVTYAIVPPVPAVAKDWLYSVSVQNKGEGGIRLTILDVTKKP